MKSYVAPSVWASLVTGNLLYWIEIRPLTWLLKNTSFLCLQKVLNCYSNIFRVIIHLHCVLLWAEETPQKSSCYFLATVISSINTNESNSTPLTAIHADFKNIVSTMFDTWCGKLWIMRFSFPSPSPSLIILIYIFLHHIIWPTNLIAERVKSDCKGR